MIRFDNHAFKGLDEALQKLHADLTAMGEGAKQLLGLMPDAIRKGGEETFARAKEIDKRVNEAEIGIDQSVAAIINKFTVMGEDLRYILGAVKIASTLERAGDKLKNCIKRLSKVRHPVEAPVERELLAAAAALEAMLPLALGQILEFSPEAGQQLLAHGAVVQKSYRSILLALHAHTATAEDETHILLVAKNLEQAADMVVEVMKTSHYIHFATKFDKRAGAIA